MLRRPWRDAVAMTGVPPLPVTFPPRPPFPTNDDGVPASEGSPGIGRRGHDPL
jgi:hypothetical protein